MLLMQRSFCSTQIGNTRHTICWAADGNAAKYFGAPTIQEREMSQIAADLGVLSQREFRVGAAVSKTFRIFSRNAVPFSLIAIIVWLPVGFVEYYTLDMPQQQQQLWNGAAAGLGGILQLVAVAAILFATFQDMRGRPVRIGESVQRGLRRFFPLIGGGFLVGLGVVAGFILLIVPGFMWLTRWYVFAPVCVVEQKGPLGSMKRSAELTKGSRWKLFAIFIIIMLVGSLTGGAIALVLASSRSPLAVLAFQGIWQGVWSAFNNILSVVIYHDLRVTKEGADIESIASVFD
jgi:hypothetical protein